MPLIAAALPIVQKLLGGGGGSPPAPATSGDATSGLDAPFQYNAQFAVGGSGNQSASQTASQDAAHGTSTGIDQTTLIYIGAGVVGLALVFMVLKK